MAGRIVRLLALCALLAVSAQPALAHDLVVKLSLSANELRAHDLLLAKVELVNTTDQPFTLKDPFCNGSGTVRFQKLLPVGAGTLNIELPGQGLLCVITMPREIPPRGSYATYVGLLANGQGKAVFGSAGHCQLQAVVTVNREHLTSEPQPLRIIEPAILTEEEAESHRLALKTFGAPKPWIHTGLTDAVVIATYPELQRSYSQIKRLEQALPECELQRTLQWARALGAVKWQDRAVREPGEAAFQKYFAQLAPVAREFAALNATQRYLEIKEFERAEQFLALVTTGSDVRNSLATQIQYRREQERLLQGKP